MPDPVRAAAEALLENVHTTSLWQRVQNGEVSSFPYGRVDLRYVDALRAALAAPPPRDERAEAAVAVMEAADRQRAILDEMVQNQIHGGGTFGLPQKLDKARADEVAARRRWAEVEGRTT